MIFEKILVCVEKSTDLITKILSSFRTSYFRILRINLRFSVLSSVECSCVMYRTVFSINTEYRNECMFTVGEKKHFAYNIFVA